MTYIFGSVDRVSPVEHLSVANGFLSRHIDRLNDQSLRREDVVDEVDARDYRRDP